MLQWWTKCLWLLLRNRASWLLAWVVCPKLMLLWLYGSVQKGWLCAQSMMALWQILMLVALFIRNPYSLPPLAEIPCSAGSGFVPVPDVCGSARKHLCASAGTSCREGPSAQGCCGYRAAAAWLFLFSWACCVSCVSRQPCDTNTWDAGTALFPLLNLM